MPESVASDSKPSAALSYHTFLRLSFGRIRRPHPPRVVFKGPRPIRRHDAHSPTLHGALFRGFNQLFDLIDRDHDGTMTTAEFEQAMVSIHAALSPRDIEAVLSECDSDKSGNISKAEFTEMLRKYDGYAASMGMR